MTTVSVVTLARGRADHLANVVRGLARQTEPPVELVIAAMQPQPYDALPDTPFPVRQLPIPGDALPLAAARNAAARAAAGDTLVFLDVDCIPTPELCADYARACATLDGLLMGEVMFLPGGATDAGLDFARFAAVAEKHSDRDGRPGQPIRICEDYRCFWSLSFAMRRATFLATGGFDERYVGYGGEDTDFGKTIAGQGVPIAWMQGALSYHQYHPHHMPPVHHIDSVVRNAELFERKWGYRTMGHWLDAFAVMGLIDSPPGRLIEVLRGPEDAERALTANLPHQPYSNTASVLRTLRAHIEGERVEAA